MAGKAYALARQQLLDTLTAYEGTTTADGAAGGTTLVDSNLIGSTDYITEKTILIMDGPCAHQDRGASSFVAGTGTITCPAFTAQITLGTTYRILNISSTQVDVLDILTRIGTNADAAGTTTLFAWLAKLFAGLQSGEGLCYYGKVATVPGATQFTSTELVGKGDGKFAGTQGFYFVFVLRDAGGLGAAPQGEYRAISAYSSATGLFTHAAFSAALVATDEVLIVHSSIVLGEGVIAYGTFTTSSATVPADTGKGAFASNYFRGCMLMPISGVCAFQPRSIRSFTTATGVFILDPATPFTAAPGLVDYVILPNTEIYAATADSTLNVMPHDVIGNKGDAAVAVASATASIPAYLKGLLMSRGGLVYKGVVTTLTSPTQFDALGLAGFGNQAFANGQYFIFCFRDVGAAAAFPQSTMRLLQTYVSATGTFTHEAFDVDLTVGDEIVIIHQSLLFPNAVPGFGALDTSSATVPADSTRAANYPTEVADHFKGMLLMPIAGACRFISRRIVGFTLAGGIFTIDPNNPFPAAPGTVEYLIINDQKEFVSSKQLLSMDFWSDPQEEVQIPAVAGTLALPSVTVADLPAGITVARAVALLKCRAIENTNVAANKLDGATVAATSQVIQVRDDTPGTWRDAINFVDDQFGIAASTREGGDVLIGSPDIAVEVDGNDTYNFQYLLAKADLAALNLNDVQVGLRIWYSI